MDLFQVDDRRVRKPWGGGDLSRGVATLEALRDGRERSACLLDFYMFGIKFQAGQFNSE